MMVATGVEKFNMDHRTFLDQWLKEEAQKEAQRLGPTNSELAYLQTAFPNRIIEGCILKLRIGGDYRLIEECTLRLEIYGDDDILQSLGGIIGDSTKWWYFKILILENQDDNSLLIVFRKCSLMTKKISNDIEILSQCEFPTLFKIRGKKSQLTSMWDGHEILSTIPIHLEKELYKVLAKTNNDIDNIHYCTSFTLQSQKKYAEEYIDIKCSKYFNNSYDLTKHKPRNKDIALYKISFTKITIDETLELLEDIVDDRIILHSICIVKNISFSMECSSMRKYIISKGIKESDIQEINIQFYNEDHTLKIR